MESKYYGLFLPLGLLGFLAFSPDHRHWLRRRESWAAAGIALVVNLPTLAWNLANGWASLRFQSVDRLQFESTWSWGRLWAFQLSHVLLLTPILAAAAWISGVRTVVRWKTSRWEDRFLASLGVPILAFFLVIAILKPVRDHWAAPAYLTLIVLACASPPWSSGKWSRWLDGGGGPRGRVPPPRGSRCGPRAPSSWTHLRPT
jgi:4-amino-4-deoxy-L-arabinose transferase-like glycosyltransferase